MFNLDERLKGLPAVKEQVVSLFQSLNNPHLAIPGKKAGPSTAFVLGLRGPSGFAAFVYLYLHESSECAVYVPSNGAVPGERYESEEAEALGFVESMGFIMDNLNFRGRPAEEQDGFLRTLPVFQREPPKSAQPAAQGEPGAPASDAHASITALGKLFSAFCLALAVGLAGCAHVGDKEREASRIHYELAVQELVHDPQSAFKEVETALSVNPDNAGAWMVKGLLLHLSFGRLEEARQAFEKALSLQQPFAEANVNLGNLYMDLKRYDDAIAQYQLALNDVLFRDTFMARGNMGWALYLKGEVPQAVEQLKASVTINPSYCRGYQQLGTLYQAQGNPDESCRYFGHYKDKCPDQPDAWQHKGLCLLREGKQEEARKAFAGCVERAKDDDLKDECTKLRTQAGG